jgi:Tfp pilus assembly protein PilO
VKDQIVKNFHWFIIMYALWGLYTIYEEKQLEIEAGIAAIPPVEEKILKAKRKIADIEKFKQNLSQSKERVEEVVKQIEKVQKQLPSDVNDTEVQELIGGIATKLRIKEPAPNPGKEANNGFYFTKEYEFSGQGTFIQFLIFFENLDKAERILNVQKVKLNLDPNSMKSRFPIVNINTTIESYRYNTSYREKSVVKEIENQYQIE